MLHVLSWIESPDVQWFCRLDKVTLKLGDYIRVDAYYPMWLMMRYRTETGATVEFTLPEPGICLN